MSGQRILIVNKFYYRRGGDCVHALGLERLLRDRGHEVAVLSTAHPSSLPSPWSGYWLRPVGFDSAASSRLTALRRMLGLDETASAVRRLLRDFRPDVVHLHNIHSHLSPVVAREAHKAGCRVVWTLHDYKLVCPAYTLLCHGRVCTSCVGDASRVVRNRCMKGSLAASIAARAESLRWPAASLRRWTDVFVCPSSFMRSVMERGGYDPASLLVVPNFCRVAQSAERGATPQAEEPYYCYAGRISPEKGVETLLRAAIRLPYRLKIAGEGPQLEDLRARYGGNANIEWLGMLDAEGVANLVAGSRLSVVPSQWHENSPLSVIESLCAGTPVAGARMGGIPELLEPERQCGRLFPAGDAKALADAVSDLWTHGPSDGERRAMAQRSRRRFSPDAYYRSMLKAYSPFNIRTNIEKTTA